MLLLLITLYFYYCVFFLSVRLFVCLFSFLLWTCPLFSPSYATIAYPMLWVWAWWKGLWRLVSYQTEMSSNNGYERYSKSNFKVDFICMYMKLITIKKYLQFKYARKSWIPETNVWPILLIASDWNWEEESDNSKTPQKTSITQRLRTDIGRSVLCNMLRYPTNSVIAWF